VTGSTALRAVLIFLMTALPLVYFSRIWSLCVTAANGDQYNWDEIGWYLTVFGVIVIVGELMFAAMLFDMSKSRPKMPQTVVIEHTIVVLPPPAPMPLIERKEQAMLLGALVAGLLGGLLALFFIKKGNKQS
jgi:uncharacterized membrane protein